VAGRDVAVAAAAGGDGGSVDTGQAVWDRTSVLGAPRPVGKGPSGLAGQTRRSHRQRGRTPG